MLEIGVQTKNVIEDENPLDGFKKLAAAGFTCCDFSLNSYLYNKDIYAANLNSFFSKSTEELIEFFRPHKEAAKKAEAEQTEAELIQMMTRKEEEINLNIINAPIGRKKKTKDV